MNEQELAYIGSFDPYEDQEFETILIRVTDGITGISIAEAEAFSISDIYEFLTTTIATHFILSSLLTISILPPEQQKFWNIVK